MDINTIGVLFNVTCNTMHILPLYNYGKCNLSKIPCYINCNLNFSLIYLLRLSPAQRFWLGKYPKTAKIAICLSRVSQSPTIVDAMGPKEAKTMRLNESSRHFRQPE